MVRCAFDCLAAISQRAPMSSLGRLHSVAIGCFRKAQLQGPLFGDEPGKAAGMSRPDIARRVSPKLPDAQPRLFRVSHLRSSRS